MAKFYGTIGFSKTEETSPGVWQEKITEKNYYGDILQFTHQWQNGEHLNDDINVNNKISIVADSFAFENFGFMRYVYWMSAKWKITNIDVQYPRLILTIGGIYNQ